MLDYFCGNTPYHHIWRHIFHYHCIGGYDRIVAHGDIAQNLCAAVDGHIVAYRRAVGGIGVSYRHSLIHPTILTD